MRLAVLGYCHFRLNYWRFTVCLSIERKLCVKLKIIPIRSVWAEAWYPSAALFAASHLVNFALFIFCLLKEALLASCHAVIVAWRVAFCTRWAALPQARLLQFEFSLPGGRPGRWQISLLSPQIYLGVFLFDTLNHDRLRVALPRNCASSLPSYYFFGSCSTRRWDEHAVLYRVSIRLLLGFREGLLRRVETFPVSYLPLHFVVAEE